MHMNRFKPALSRFGLRLLRRWLQGRLLAKRLWLWLLRALDFSQGWAIRIARFGALPMLTLSAIIYLLPLLFPGRFLVTPQWAWVSAGVGLLFGLLLAEPLSRLGKAELEAWEERQDPDGPVRLFGKDRPPGQFAMPFFGIVLAILFFQGVPAWSITLIFGTRSEMTLVVSKTGRASAGRNRSCDDWVRFEGVPSVFNRVCGVPDAQFAKVRRGDTVIVHGRGTWLGMYWTSIELVPKVSGRPPP